MLKVPVSEVSSLTLMRDVLVMIQRTSWPAERRCGAKSFLVSIGALTILAAISVCKKYPTAKRLGNQTSSIVYGNTPTRFKANKIIKYARSDCELI